MKKMLFAAVLAISTNVFAQGNTLIYCDYNAAVQEESVYMDLYLNFDATANTYTNLEVGVLNAENTGYPDYLYSTGVIMGEAATAAQVSIAKDANTIGFELPATSLVVNGFPTPNYQVVVVDGKVNNFDVVANGMFNGKDLVNVTFTCYDPASTSQVPQQQVR